MRTVLVALLAAALGVPAGDLTAQVLEKAAPEETHLTLTGVHRMGMTYARRIEGAEPSEAEAATRLIGQLAEEVEESGTALDEMAKAIGPGYEAQVEGIRKFQQAARPHVQALSGLKDKPLSAAARSHAAAIREQLDLAESAHQKLMKTLSATKADAPKPEIKVDVPKPDTAKAQPPKPAGS